MKTAHPILCTVVVEGSGRIGPCCRRVETVENDEGVVIGFRCFGGHILGVDDPKRKRRCRGCGSGIEGKHATGCSEVILTVDAMISNCTGLAAQAVCDDEWFEVQELIESVLGLGTSMTGGAL
jgi:hypothetical protein